MRDSLIDRVRERLAAEAGQSTELRPQAVAAAIRAESGGVLGDTEMLSSLRVLQTELSGAGVLEPLLCSPGTTDVLVTAPDAVWVDDGAGLRRSDIRFADEAAVRRLAQRLAVAAGRRLDDAQPWVDGQLHGFNVAGTGEFTVRLHAILPPVAAGGTCLSLRVLRPATQAAALLSDIITARLAFLVSGGTGAGKTTPDQEHTLSITRRTRPRRSTFGAVVCYERWVEHIRTLTIEGLRGYQDAQTVDLAIPDGTAGSGLTVIVGANNSGKSTVIEALTALAVRNATSYSEGKRNALANSAVRIRADFVSGKTAEIRTVQSGGSQTEWSSQDVEDRDIGIIQSRRGFDPYFGSMSPLTRRDYNRDYQGQAQYRPQSLDPSFTGRLFALVRDAHGDRHIFDELLGRVMGGESLAWTIDQSDNGRYYIKFKLEASGLSHSSEGVGEGINSLFVILSALYDLDATSVVAIDEPELSLHPQYQRRLRQVLADRAAHSQIIYTTHSPYFVDWNDIANGATIVRAHKRDAGGLALRQPSRAVLSDLISLLRNDNSPHTLSLHASEIFFVEDRVIITEGQEDVVFFPKIDSALGISMQGSFYGWGAGGASNISKVCRLLRDLGYTKVVAIFDGDKASEADACREEFPDYHVAVLPADDIRSKSASTKAAKKGLWDGGKFDETKRSETVAMYESVNAYFSGISAATN